MWDIWLAYCEDLSLDPYLPGFEDKVPILQVFMHRLRSGELAPKKKKIKARSVEDYVRAVAQSFLQMGDDDPRLNTAQKTDFRLLRSYAAWKKEDPPAWRVKPVPISVLRHVCCVA